jgi:hypothetical protein
VPQIEIFPKNNLHSGGIRCSVFRPVFVVLLSKRKDFGYEPVHETHRVALNVSTSHGVDIHHRLQILIRRKQVSGQRIGNFWRKRQTHCQELARIRIVQDNIRRHCRKTYSVYRVRYSHKN